MFAELPGAIVLEADAAGLRLQLPDGRHVEVFPIVEHHKFTSERTGSLDVPTLYAYEKEAV
jgi:hypothetical protein